MSKDYIATLVYDNGGRTIIPILHRYKIDFDNIVLDFHVMNQNFPSHLYPCLPPIALEIIKIEINKLKSVNRFHLSLVIEHGTLSSSPGGLLPYVG